MLNNFFDTVFGFLLNWPPLWAIFFLALLISFITVVAYKYFTNQKEMKELKSALKEHQKSMREHKDNPDKLLDIHKKAMEINMVYFKKSIKPTLITFLPIILIFQWMVAHFSYEPLRPGVPFTITATFEKNIVGNASIIVPEGITITSENTTQITDHKAQFTLKGEKGEYFVTIKTGNNSQDKQIIITNQRVYSDVKQTYNGAIAAIELSNNTLHVLGPLGWFWTYLISAIFFSVILRKVMKVH